MSRLEELFLRWQEEDLSPQETEELLRLLETPEARALLMDDFVATNTIREALRTEDARAQGSDPRNAELPSGDFKGPAKPLIRRSAVPPRRGPGLSWGKLLMAAAALLFGIALILAYRSSMPDGSTASERDARRAEQNRRKIEEAERAREEERRKQAGIRLLEIEQQRRQLTQPVAPKDQDPAAEEKRRKSLEELKNERERIERELQQAIPPSKPPPEETPKRVAEQAPSPEKKLEGTVIEIARIEKVVGESFRVRAGSRDPAKAGDVLLAGDSLVSAGERSAVTLSYADKTRIDLLGDTELRNFAAGEKGKRVDVAKGRVRAKVAKQLPGQPMIFATPQGDAVVLGTSLRLVVAPGDKGATRLEVEEGKVQLKNLAGKTVDVVSGHYAVAAVGMELVSKLGIAPAGLSVGLVGHWRMDDAPGSVAADDSDEGHHGHVVNDASFAKGKLAGAIRFNGSNQYVNLGKGWTFPGPVTFALWVKLNSLATQTMISDHNAGGTLCHHALEVTPGGQVRYFWLQGDQVLEIQTQEALTSGVWYHLAVTKDDSGNVKLFVNGRVIERLTKKNPARVNLADGFGALSLGRPGDLDKCYLNGLVDDVHVYNRSLAAEEIVILAKLGDR